ncbi:DUF4252 domain-containing protein [Sinomicrobium soli]|uniref:DUF4252 domain-containing protein n=1 Tax=Sinomicrobium sp. N-1-3-6 TaxID=2219864 RepID=UPI000DCE650C|nr:DUF4252 domain-containing protein [Sinomicrobium sp. N-1-3-6]RAV30330.1 DUF4252 domain-containing protein [Sinomicrobium sp. N-1-3-6]
MKISIDKVVYAGAVLGFFALMVAGCGKKESLQQYYVNSAEKEGFINLELPAGMLDVSKLELTPEQKEAYTSIKKLNVLALPVTAENEAVFREEKEKINTILADDNFEELFRLSDKDKRAVLKYLGDEEAIDEVVFFGADDERGFVLVRILGKDMSPERMVEFVKLMENSDIDEGQLGSLKELLGS